MSVSKSGQFAQEIPCPGHKRGSSCPPSSKKCSSSRGHLEPPSWQGRGERYTFTTVWASTSCRCPCPVSPPLPGLQGGPARIGQFSGFPNSPPKSEKKTWSKIFPEMELKTLFLLKKKKKKETGNGFIWGLNVSGMEDAFWESMGTAAPQPP